MKKMNRCSTLAILVSFALAACAEDVAPIPTDGEETVKPEATETEGGKEDAWDWRNDPERFDGTFVYELAQLPSEGRSETEAWPSTYWPTYENSINARWLGPDELSPAEKYDRAFNGWTPAEGFMDLRPFSPGDCENGFDEAYYQGLGPLATHISRYMGNWRSHDGEDSDGDNEIDECDASSYDGVETWFGLCHAWVPAAMLEDRPLRSVTHNDVTFHVADMEALLIAAYNRTPADMIGGRCNIGAGDDEVTRDEHGRAEANECRDTNPGAMHVIMSNYLGRGSRPYAEDRTFDYQVWNQPVIAFNVTRNNTLTEAEANALIGVEGDDYPFNDDAVAWADVHANTTYITESHASQTPAEASHYERTDYYTYVLELDADGKIIGGEYYGNSQTSHPDFLWNPRQLTSSSVPNLNLQQVRMLVQMSREPVTPPPTGNVVTVTGQGGVAIPDDDTAGASATADVSNSVTIAGLQLELNIRHTYIADLNVTLTHDGVTRVVHNNTGGSDDNIETTLTVTGFEGTDAVGEWTLAVVDSWAQDTGTIVDWSLVITPEGAGGGGGGSAETFPGEGGIAIPDNDANGITSDAVLPQGQTGAAQVAVNITHTWRGDLRLVVTNGSQSWTLHDKDGGSADDIVSTYTLDPQPQGDLGGTWTLTVSDHAGRDTGTLNSWSVIVTE
jgi:subtilisin-like proprotein convertase family protein